MFLGESYPRIISCLLGLGLSPKTVLKCKEIGLETGLHSLPSFLDRCVDCFGQKSVVVSCCLSCLRI